MAAIALPIVLPLPIALPFPIVLPLSVYVTRYALSKGVITLMKKAEAIDDMLTFWG